jgi:hypothetical protein
MVWFSMQLCYDDINGPRAETAFLAAYPSALDEYFHSAGRSSPLKMLQFPKSIMLVAISTFIAMIGRAATRQAIGTLLQESSHGGRFSCNPRSREQTAVNTSWCMP